MKKILRNHSILVLAVLAFIFLSAIIASYVWGITYLIFDINEANGRTATGMQIPQFNLDAAAQLNYRRVSASTNAIATTTTSTLQQP
jgi:hypothetical protein